VSCHDIRRAVATAATLQLPVPTHAHLVNTGFGPFYDCVSHFLLAPEDALPALGLALLAGLRGARGGELGRCGRPSAAWLVAARRVSLVQRIHGFGGARRSCVRRMDSSWTTHWINGDRADTI